MQEAGDSAGAPLQSQPAVPAKPAAAPKQALLFLVSTAVALAAAVVATTLAWQREVVLTVQQLQQYDGEQRAEVYLAVLGQVYRVTAGKRHYGVGGMYSVLAARDASRILATSDFSCTAECDRTDDVSEGQLEALDKWLGFYEGKYPRMGVVVGRYYDGRGAATPELLRTRERLRQLREGRGPGQAGETEEGAGAWCNVHYTKDKGKEVYCNEGEVPRQVAHIVPNSGRVVQRCRCYTGVAHDDQRRLYAGCEPSSGRCKG